MNPAITAIIVLSMLLSSVGPMKIPAKELPDLSQGAIAVNIQNDVTPTPTANWPYPPPGEITSTPTSSPTLEPTIYITPELSTETVTPTPTSQPTITPTSQLTATLTSTVVPAPAQMELGFSPRYITKEKPVTLSWHLIGSDTFSPKDGYQIVILLPEGLLPNNSEDGIYDPATHELKVSSDKQSSHIRLETIAGFEGPFNIQVSLLKNSQVLAKAETEVEKADGSFVQKAGGEAKGLNDKIVVRFSPGSLNEDATIYIKSVHPKKKFPYLLVGEPFEIIAVSTDETKEIHQFPQPIEIQVQYDNTMFLQDESNLTLAYFDENKQTWERFFTRVDTDNNLVIATSEHLTIGSLDINSWEAGRLPSVASFQTSQFTGAATYNFPFWMPPGPGGLQPSLNLNYNSQVVESGNTLSQASWVGMGWSLDTGYIERNMMGTPDDQKDDTFSITAGGVSSLMLKTGTSGNYEYYHTTDESFWQITRDTQNNLWTARDKTGTLYTFGGNNNYTHSQTNYPYLAKVHYADQYDLRNYCDVATIPWRWSLSEVKNTFGQALTYTYTPQTTTANISCPFGTETKNADLAVYPKTIEYPNHCYSVAFNTVSDRKDYLYSWENGTTFFQKSRLSNIQIKQDPSCSGAYSRVIRQWNFGYASQANEFIFPNYVWPGWPSGNPGGRTLTLTSLQEFGVDTASSYPQITFKYDGMHLQEANNGQGGRVQFKYESWYEPYDADLTYACRTSDSSGFCQTNPGTGWHKPSREVVDNSNVPGGVLLERDESHTGLWQWVHPGMAIRLYAKFSQSITFQTGFRYWNPTLSTGQIDILCPNRYSASDPNYVSTRDQTVECGNNQNPGNYVFFLPVGTSNVKGDLLKCDQTCSISYFDRVMLPTRYRVIQKTVIDDVKNVTQNYLYRYDGAAMNDKIVSTAANTTLPYNKPYTEFRGNAMVQQESPDGRVDTTFFYQDDSLKGRSSINITHTQRIFDPFIDLNLTGWTTVSAKKVERLEGDSALQLTGTASDWSVTTARQNAADQVKDGESVLIQFRKEGSAETKVELRSNSSARWGIYAAAGGLYQIYQVNGQEVQTQLSLNGYASGKWYVAILTRDDQGKFLSYVWERNNPANAVLFQGDMPDGLNWTFNTSVKNGIVWLDSYIQGKIYTLNQSVYNSGSETDVWTPPTVTLPQKNGSSYTGLSIVWPRITEQTTFTFEGSGQPMRVKIKSDYDPSLQNNSQFGNLTRTTEYRWNGTAWITYRKQETNFYPNSGNNLVGLPALQASYAYDDTCSCFSLIAETQFWYGTKSAYNEAPDTGAPSVKRTLLTIDQGTKYYSDEVYGYDSWGNQIRLTRYSEPGQNGSLSTSGAQTTTTCYGVEDQPSGCVKDLYFTFMSWQKDALGHKTSWTYDLLAAAPFSETDANLATTYAGYDGLGRIKWIAKPGDTSVYPTISVNYNDTALPIWTQASLKIDESRSQTIRKYYDGVGQLIQTQAVKVDIFGVITGLQDMVVDYDYRVVYDLYDNAFHKQVLQSAPYVVEETGGYHTPDPAQPVTRTIYDVLGRTERVYAMDTPYDPNHPEASSPSKKMAYRVEGLRQLTINSTRKDGAFIDTKTYQDEWGRVVQIVSPKKADGTDNPSIIYEYDQNNRLKKTTYGTAISTIDYDYAGRKYKMTDPDLGEWDYTYDALGNLKTQVDSRECQTTLTYDELNRLKTKEFSASTCPEPNEAISYTYDEYEADDPANPSATITTKADIKNKGYGRRTGMKDYSGSTYWEYDLRGRVIHEQKTVIDQGDGDKNLGIYDTYWSYLSNDAVKQMVYPNLETVNYTFNRQGEISQVYSILNGTTEVKQYYVNSIEYDAAGRTVNRILGNQLLQTSFEYYGWGEINGLGRLHNLSTAKLSDQSKSLQELGYSYDEVGNILSIDEVVDILSIDNQPDQKLYQQQAFTYDALSRLHTASVTGTSQGQGDLYTETYEYDGQTGNLATVTNELTHATQSYGYDSSRPHAVTSLNGVQKYWYGDYNQINDSNGNMTKRIVKDANGAETSYSLGYDAENQLAKISITNGAEVARYIYDGDGKRVLTVVNGLRTVYIGNYFEAEIGNEVTQVTLPELTNYTNCHPNCIHKVFFPAIFSDSSGAIGMTIGNFGNFYYHTHQQTPGQPGITWRLTYYAGGQGVAVRKGFAAGDLSFLMTDHLGSISKTVSDTGSVSIMRYKAWGDIRYSSGSSPTQRKYTGQLAAEAGLIFYNARFYDSYLNRFLSPDSIIPDPYNPLDWDRYSYARNNAVKYNDPTGHCPVCFIPSLINYATLTGLRPDLEGIRKAEKAMGGNTGSIEVAAGLAVQGQFATVEDDVAGMFSESPGIGLAQVGSVELKDLGMENANPHDPAVAVEVMQSRIKNAQGACENCTSGDMLIVAALAQNGEFKTSQAITDLRQVSRDANGKGIDWKNFIDNTYKAPLPPEVRVRMPPGMTNFRYLLVMKYIQDLRELSKRGWTLPDDYDLDYYENWAKNSGKPKDPK